MVSKASEDLPEPESPVMTVRRLRGMATETFLRLCSRAPRTRRNSWDIAPKATRTAARGSTGSRFVRRRLAFSDPDDTLLTRRAGRALAPDQPRRAAALPRGGHGGRSAPGRRHPDLPGAPVRGARAPRGPTRPGPAARSEEHTSELQSPWH